MRYRTLGQTGLVVSELCLGTMTFGSSDGIWAAIAGAGQQDANALVKQSFDAGINFFDTADVYANGQSEEIFGQSLHDLGLSREEVVIASKVHGRLSVPNAAEGSADWRRATGRNLNGLSRKHILHAIDDSLRRLKTGYIDLYQIHGYDPLTPLEEVLETMDILVRTGKVRYIGLCNRMAWEITKSLWISDKRGLARFESLQMFYSIACRDLEHEIVPLALDQNLAILPWSPLAGGLMSGKYKREGASEGRRATFDFPPVEKDRAFDIVDAMRPIAAAHGASVAQVALGWLLAKPWVTSVIIGAKRPDQLADNLKAAELALTLEDLAQLDEVSAPPTLYPEWMTQRQGSDRAGQVG